MPKRIAISSLYRLSKAGHEAGRVYILDYNGMSVVSSFTGVAGKCVHNVGHSIGFRGISFYDNKLYVVTNDGNLVCYNSDTLELLSSVDLRKRGVAEPHQIKEHNGLLYVVSTGNDSYAVLDGTSVVRTVRLGDVSSLLSDKISDVWKKSNHWPSDKLHFNSIGWDEDGDEYHLYFSAGIVYNYSRKEVVVHSEKLRSAHDLCYKDGCFFISGSVDRTVYKVDISSGAVQKVFSVDDHEDITVERLSRHALYRHVRGLYWTGSSLLVCCSPVKVYELVEKPNGSFSVLNARDYSDTEYEAVYDIDVC